MASNPDWAGDVNTGTRRMNSVGLAAVVVFGAGFCIWAILAPLASAAVAPGVIAAPGQNQRVQHLEGGIVQEIFVREGDRVESNQPLFKLDPTVAEAQRDRLRKQLVALSARAARLAAERDGQDTLIFSEALQERAAEIGVSALLDEQAKEFSTRLERHRQELVILGQRKLALNEQVIGMTAQGDAVEQQLAVVEDEEERKKDLLDRGLTSRSEYTDLLRSKAELLGQLGQSNASVLAAKTQITEAEEQIARARTQRVEVAATQLNDLRVQISDAEEQLRAATELLERTVVRAPSDGLVVRIEHNSRGSVVRPGDTLLELLPTGESLIVEAQVSPQDVDVMSIGQAATLRFSALNTRTTPTVDATVFYISADRLVNEATGQPYYTARLRITDELPPEITEEQIYPGMPVETYARTGERTFLTYLVKPIADSFNRAFRED